MKSTKSIRWLAGLGGGIVLALAVLTGARYARDMRTYRQRIDQMGSQLAETPCGVIEYARVGTGSPVLVIHGNGGGFDQGLGLAQTYLGEGFQLIAPSRFGYLRSPLPADATPESQADAYACLLDALQLDRVAVLTTSAGVTSAVQFAMRHPERVTALVLHSPNAPGKVEMQLPPKAILTAMFKSDFIFWGLMTTFGPSMRTFVGVPKDFALTADMENAATEALFSVLPSSARADGMIFDTFVSNPAINHYTFEHVQAPTLVISAVDDPMALHVNARALAEQIPGARFSAIQDGGHLMLGHEAEVRAEIRQFLNQFAAIKR